MTCDLGPKGRKGLGKGPCKEDEGAASGGPEAGMSEFSVGCRDSRWRDCTAKVEPREENMALDSGSSCGPLLPIPFVRGID